MAKQKLIFLLGPIFVLLIVAGYISSNWSTDITDTTTEDESIYANGETFTENR